MGRKLKDVLATLPAARRNAIKARSAVMVGEMIQASLADLRKAANKTQVEVAESMGLRQHGISQLERRQDLRLSTLDRFARAVGGHLHVIVQLPDGKRYAIAQGNGDAVSATVLPATPARKRVTVVRKPAAVVRTAKRPGAR